MKFGILVVGKMIERRVWFGVGYYLWLEDCWVFGEEMAENRDMNISSSLFLERTGGSVNFIFSGKMKALYLQIF